MDAVIRAARVHDEPVLLAIAAARPVLVAMPLRTPGAARFALARPMPDSAPRVEAPTPALLEADLRCRLDAEREQVLREARDAGFESGQQHYREEGRAEGREEGLREGREEGCQQSRADWAERVAALDRLLASTGAALEAGIGGSDELMIDIAFEAVCKILGAALVTRDGVAGVVRQAVHGVRERERLVIRLAPRDVDTLTGLHAELSRLAGAKTLEIVADERIELGGCLIETADGGLDGRLETQLQRLRDVLSTAHASAGAVT